MGHTPGPWRVFDGSLDIICNNASHHRFIAEALESFTKQSSEIDLEAPCNARLIAAAPDLVEALRGLLDMVTDNRTHGQEVYDACKALNKAQGV